MWSQVGSWQVRVDDSLGGDCFVFTVYEGNTIFRLGFDTDNQSFYAMVGDDDWRSLETGKQYQLKMTFGNETPWSGPAYASRIGEIPVLIMKLTDTNNFKAFMNEFMREHTVNINYDDKSIAYLTLKGSYKAGLTLLNCQEQVANFKSSTDIDPFNSSNNKSEIDPFSQPYRTNDRDPFAVNL